MSLEAVSPTVRTSSLPAIRLFHFPINRAEIFHVMPRHVIHVSSNAKWHHLYNDLQFKRYPCPVFSTFPLYQAPNYAPAERRRSANWIDDFRHWNREVTVISVLKKMDKVSKFRYCQAKFTVRNTAQKKNTSRCDAKKKNTMISIRFENRKVLRNHWAMYVAWFCLITKITLYSD